MALPAGARREACSPRNVLDEYGSVVINSVDNLLRGQWAWTKRILRTFWDRM